MASHTLTRLVLPGLVVLVGMLAPATASAWTTITGVASPQTAALYREWQAASDIPTPHVAVPVAERDCVEEGSISCVLGCEAGPMTLVYADPTWLWREPDSPERVVDRLAAQAIFYHELGHIRDCQVRKSYGYRKAFARAMGWTVRSDLSPAERREIDDERVTLNLYQGWGVCVDVSSESCVDPREHFAMASAWCSVSRSSRPVGEWAAGYGYAPTAAQHAAVCELLDAPLR